MVVVAVVVTVMVVEVVVRSIHLAVDQSLLEAQDER